MRYKGVDRLRIHLTKEYFIFTGLTLLSLLAVFCRYFGIIIGLPYALFVPGYLVTAALFPKADDINGLTRISFSVGLSIIIVPLIGLLQNNFPWGIRLLPMMLSLAIFNMAFMGLGWFRRNKLPEEQRFTLTVRIDLTKLKEKPKVIKIIDLAILAVILLILAFLFFILLSPKSNSGFTEFYITGPKGVAADYPDQLKAGEDGTVKLTVVNKENQETSYRIEIRVDGELNQSINRISLENHAKWEKNISFNVKKANETAKVEFFLFRGNTDTAPYRQLSLRVKVLS